MTSIYHMISYKKIGTNPLKKVKSNVSKLIQESTTIRHGKMDADTNRY